MPRVLLPDVRTLLLLRVGRVNLAELRLAAKQIRERVNLRTVAEAFGLDWSGRDRGSRYECPGCREFSKSKKTVQISGEGQDAHWYCHHCREGGDAISLVAASLGVRPGRAIGELAARYGISSSPEDVVRYLLSEVRKPRSEAARDAVESEVREVRRLFWTIQDPRDPAWVSAWECLERAAEEGRRSSVAAVRAAASVTPPLVSRPFETYAIQALATRYAQDGVLIEHPLIDHFLARGLTDRDYEEWGFGVCLGPSVARSELHRDDWEAAKSCGLIRSDGTDAMDGRLTIPIRDVVGNCVALAGRSLDPAAPKYLNTRESPVFQKRRHLFGIDLAYPMIQMTGRAILVEGYMDAIAMHRAGFPETVAVMGTAPTHYHAELLARCGAGEVVLFFDDDDGGRSATARGFLAMQHPRFSVRSVTAGNGMDPDKLISTQGPEAVREILDAEEPGDDLRSRLSGRPRVK